MKTFKNFMSSKILKLIWKQDFVFVNSRAAALSQAQMIYVNHRSERGMDVLQSSMSRLTAETS